MSPPSAPLQTLPQFAHSVTLDLPTTFTASGRRQLQAEADAPHIAQLVATELAEWEIQPSAVGVQVLDRPGDTSVIHISVSVLDKRAVAQDIKARLEANLVPIACPTGLAGKRAEPAELAERANIKSL